MEHSTAGLRRLAAPGTNDLLPSGSYRIENESAGRSTVVSH